MIGARLLEVLYFLMFLHFIRRQDVGFPPHIQVVPGYYQLASQLDSLTMVLFFWKKSFFLPFQQLLCLPSAVDLMSKSCRLLNTVLLWVCLYLLIYLTPSALRKQSLNISQQLQLGFYVNIKYYEVFSPSQLGSCPYCTF